jgi:hypothetical protein
MRKHSVPLTFLKNNSGNKHDSLGQCGMRDEKETDRDQGIEGFPFLSLNPIRKEMGNN